MSYWVGGWRPSFHFVKLWPSFTSSSFASPPANPTTAQGGVSFFLVVPSVSDWSLGMVQPMSPFEVTSTLKYLAAWPSSIWPLSGANKVLRRVSHIYIYIYIEQPKKYRNSCFQWWNRWYFLYISRRWRSSSALPCHRSTASTTALCGRSSPCRTRRCAAERDGLKHGLMSDISIIFYNVFNCIYFIYDTYIILYIHLFIYISTINIIYIS